MRRPAKGAAPQAAATAAPRRAAVLFAAAAAFLVAVAPAASFAEGGEAAGPAFTLGGAVSQRSYLQASLVDGADFPEASLGYSGMTGLETTLRAASGPARAEASLEATVASGAAAGAGPEPLVTASVRTLYASLRGGAIKASLGRQVLNFGKGALYSPVDLFAAAEYSPLAISRRGTDALRLTAALGPLALAEAVAAPKADPAQGLYALRAAGYLAGVADASLVGAWNGAEEAWMAGGDAKVDLPFASVYAEAVFAFPSGGGGPEPRAAVGFDASLGDLVLAAEYFYDSRPAAGTATGAHNLYASLAYGLSDYAKLAASASVDLEAGTGSGGLVASLEVEQGTFLGLSATLTRTGSSTTAAAGLSLELRF